MLFTKTGVTQLGWLSLNRLWPMLSVCFIAIMLFSSCKSELLEPEVASENLELKATSTSTSSDAGEQPGNDNRKLDCPLIKNRVVNKGGTLQFSDMQHFWDCVECLDRDYDVYNDAYDAQYPTLTAEQLDVVDDKNRFNHWQPLLDFERSKGFSSLRASVEASIIKFLDQPADQIDFNRNPDLTTPIISETIRTLFNTRGYVQVGKKQIDQNYFDEEASGTKLFDDCCFSRTRFAIYTGIDAPALGTNKLIVIRVGVRSGLITSNTFAKSQFYKYKNNKWKRRRGRMAVSLAAQPSGGNCVLNTSDDWFKYKGFKKRRSRTATASIWLKWRENFCRQSASMARWNNEAARGVCFYEDQNTILPVKLIK